MNTTLRCVAGLALAAATFFPLAAQAQTTVSEPWVRATVAQQKATGAFMQLISVQGGRLVAAASPVAGVVEIHEMKMEGSVMKMAAVPGLDLPAGKAVELRPGGYHIMLMDLKQALKAGESVPLTLTVQDAAGKKTTLDVLAQARAPMGAMPAPGGHSHMHH